MNDRPARPTEPEHLACATCLKEIPRSVEYTIEGPDYVHYFCGLECYEAWKREKGVTEGE